MKMVVDANVVAYLINDPERAGSIEAILKGHELLAPSLLIAEIHQVLWKYRHQPGYNAEHFQLLRQAFGLLPIRTVVDETLIDSAFELALAYEMTVYDALYAALAQRESATLVTADRRLAEKAGQAGLEVEQIV